MEMFEIILARVSFPLAPDAQLLEHLLMFTF